MKITTKLDVARIKADIRKLEAHIRKTKIETKTEQRALSAKFRKAGVRSSYGLYAKTGECHHGPESIYDALWHERQEATVLYQIRAHMRGRLHKSIVKDRAVGGKVVGRRELTLEDQWRAIAPHIDEYEMESESSQAA